MKFKRLLTILPLIIIPSLFNACGDSSKNSEVKSKAGLLASTGPWSSLNFNEINYDRTMDIAFYQDNVLVIRSSYNSVYIEKHGESIQKLATSSNEGIVFDEKSLTNAFTKGFSSLDASSDGQLNLLSHPFLIENVAGKPILTDIDKLTGIKNTNLYHLWKNHHSGESYFVVYYAVCVYACSSQQFSQYNRTFHLIRKNLDQSLTYLFSNSLGIRNIQGTSQGEVWFLADNTIYKTQGDSAVKVYEHKNSIVEHEKDILDFKVIDENSIFLAGTQGLLIHLTDGSPKKIETSTEETFVRMDAKYNIVAMTNLMGELFIFENNEFKKVLNVEPRAYDPDINVSVIKIKTPNEVWLGGGQHLEVYKR